MEGEIFFRISENFLNISQRFFLNQEINYFGYEHIFETQLRMGEFGLRSAVNLGMETLQ